MEQSKEELLKELTETKWKLYKAEARISAALSTLYSLKSKHDAIGADYDGAKAILELTK